MPRPSKRPHRAALTRMLRSTGLVHVPEEAPLVELLRSLADEMDAGGGSRVYTAYLSALKDLRRVLNVSAVRPTGTGEPAAPPERPDGAPDGDPEPERNDLAAFKNKHGIAS